LGNGAASVAVGAAVRGVETEPLEAAGDVGGTEGLGVAGDFAGGTGVVDTTGGAGDLAAGTGTGAFVEGEGAWVALGRGVGAGGSFRGAEAGEPSRAERRSGFAVGCWRDNRPDAVVDWWRGGRRWPGYGGGRRADGGRRERRALPVPRS
jgi:hypothetical protein